MHWACQLGGPSDSQRHIFSSVMVTEAIEESLMVTEQLKSQ